MKKKHLSVDGQKMKIMFVSAAFPPHYTGIGAYTANMARALTACGHEVTVATTRVQGLPATDSCVYGTVLRCYDWSELRTSQLGKRLVKIAHQMQVDLVECADFLGEGGVILREERTFPVCIKSHNSGPVAIGRESEIFYPWQRWMQWLAILRTWKQFSEERYCLEHADMLTTPSYRLLSELEKQGLALPEKRWVQPNPVSLPSAKPQKEEAVRPTILFVGRLAIGKGIAYLPELVKALVPTYPDLKLVLAGGDSYARGLGSLQNWLKKRFGSLLSHVEFTGQIGRDELQKQYDHAWLIVLPSLWDTFPTVILEAMARAKPVVAGVCGGMGEMLAGTECSAEVPGSDGFIDAVSNLLADRECRQNAGHSMWKKALNSYAPELIAKQYVRQFLEHHEWS